MAVEKKNKHTKYSKHHPFYQHLTQLKRIPKIYWYHTLQYTNIKKITNMAITEK